MALHLVSPENSVPEPEKNAGHIDQLVVDKLVVSDTLLQHLIELEAKHKIDSAVLPPDFPVFPNEVAIIRPYKKNRTDPKFLNTWNLIIGNQFKAKITSTPGPDGRNVNNVEVEHHDESGNKFLSNATSSEIQLIQFIIDQEK